MDTTVITTRESLKAAKLTRLRMARAESQWNDEEIRWAKPRLMLLGVR